MSRQHDVAAALAEAARKLDVARSVEETLDSIVQTVVLALPTFDHAGISIRHRQGGIETVSGTDQIVWELDALQQELGEGPSFEAIEQQRVVVVERGGGDGRWPRYSAEATRRGVCAQLSLLLYTEEETLGVLTLCSSTAATVDPDDVHLAELFATHAAIALGRVRVEDQLNEAVATRKMIGQAVGIVTERYRIDDDRAFQFLVRVSQNSNVKLRVIAQEVVDSTNEMYAAGDPPDD
ncbi:GAF and ANTAR domain-containing protein [Nocardioides solisilvae]|uniref:GAF and ANTAR domain-containing protein n=1 Tax=Nocardioides solisilvae TaxID=1542435 RepID=UPI000D747643|nr:GAF and ANTAR domain-containing protein [Nocardioides solisilvae]